MTTWVLFAIAAALIAIGVAVFANAGKLANDARREFHGHEMPEPINVTLDFFGLSSVTWRIRGVGFVVVGTICALVAFASTTQPSTGMR